MSHDARPSPADAAPGTPPVSVVIPAYNRAATIGAAIESVLRQTWEDFELVVVDDGSTDGTLEAARRIADPRLRVIAAPHNMGAAGARNLGVAEARGTWIAFQDSDDEWLPEKLAKQMARLATPAPGRRLGSALLRPPDRRRARRPPGRAHRAPLRAGPSVTPAEGDILEPLLVRNMISHPDARGAPGRLPRARLLRRGDDPDRGLGFRAAPRAPGPDRLRRRAARAPALLAELDHPLGPGAGPSPRTRLVRKNMDLFARRPHLLARQYYILAGDNRRAGDLAAARRYLALARKTHPADPRLWAMSLYVAGLSLLAPFHGPPRPDRPAP